MIFAVITSINSPTNSVEVISNIQDVNLIVVGDKKTPKIWSHPNVHFISYDDQIELNFELSNFLPVNHYSRKNIGYLVAIQNGAKFIIDIDDDNTPFSLSFPDSFDSYDTLDNDLGFVNVYNFFTNKKIWPRGLPLNLINTNFRNLPLSKSKSNIGVWQGLANIDPDVDAIYRMTINDQIIFDERQPIVLGEGTLSPFNSQNTQFSSELFPLLYLPISVSFRFTDILRSYVAQPIMWLYGYKLGFKNANVNQYRNKHDLMEDFRSEIQMYDSKDIIEIVKRVVSKEVTIYENLFNAYKELNREKVVTSGELIVLRKWINDLKSLKN